jgi:hypothetical protein
MGLGQTPSQRLFYVRTPAQPATTNQLITDDTLRGTAQLARNARLYVATSFAAYAAVIVNLVAVLS